MRLFIVPKTSVILLYFKDIIPHTIFKKNSVNLCQVEVDFRSYVFFQSVIVVIFLLVLIMCDRRFLPVTLP